MIMDEVEWLIKKLQKGSEEERLEAARALGNRKEKKSVKPLIRRLKDADAGVRWYAAEALGNVGDAEAVEPLIELLGDEAPVVRIYVASALGKLGDARAVGPLIKALRDADSNVRNMANDALVGIGEPAVKALVEESRKPENMHLRRQISKILRWIESDAKCNKHDFGIRDTDVIPVPKVPKEFERLALRNVPKAKIA